MRKLTIAILALTLSLVNLFAQNVDYYSEKDRVKGKDYEYNIKYIVAKNEIYNKFIISNINNKITDAMQALKKGKTITSLSEIPLVQMTEKRKDIKIFKEVFTKEEIQRILDNSNPKILSKAIIINFFVDLNGNLLEVSFNLRDSPEFLSINPDKLYEFERRLKKEVKFNIPQEYIGEYKKDFNFLQGGSAIIFLDKLDYVFK